MPVIIRESSKFQWFHTLLSKILIQRTVNLYDLSKRNIKIILIAIVNVKIICVSTVILLNRHVTNKATRFTGDDTTRDDDVDDERVAELIWPPSVLHFHEYGRPEQRRPVYVLYISIYAWGNVGQVNGQLITYQLGDQWHRFSARPNVRHAVDVAVERIVPRMPGRENSLEITSR